MKIIITSLDDSNKIKVGGKHVHQNLLKKAFEKDQHLVEFVFPQKNMLYYFFRIIFKALVALKMRDRGDEFEYSLQQMSRSLVRQFSKIEKVDYIFSQDPVSALAAGKIFDRSKIAITLHGYLSRESINYSHYNEIEKRKVIQSALYYEKECLKHLDKIITVDTKVKNYVEECFKWTKKILVLKNAIDPEVFENLDKERLNTLSQYYKTKNKKVILVPRRLVRKNGVDIALRAFKKVKEESAQFKLLIMGDGPEENVLKELTEKLNLTHDDVVFLGAIPNKEAVYFYIMSDFVLVPSVIRDGVEEATSLSMLEAMAAKKKLIVSNIGGMKEVIKDGYNGFTVEPDDPDLLCQKILKVSKLDQVQLDQILKQGYDDVIKHHHYLNHAQECLQFLRDKNF